MPFFMDMEGYHPATVASLHALQWLEEQQTSFSNILDMGCGNGILSVVAAGLWHANVLAADIAEQAVADCCAYAAAHGLQDAITAIRSDGFAHPGIQACAPYDLILFNLLAEPIVAMAPLVASHLAAGGVALLGGILEWKADGVEECYRRLGFEILHQNRLTPWVSYLVRPHIPTQKPSM